MKENLPNFRSLHDAFTENEMLFYKPIIFSHTILSMAAVVDAMPKYGLHFENYEMEVNIVNIYILYVGRDTAPLLIKNHNLY